MSDNKAVVTGLVAVGIMGLTGAGAIFGVGYAAGKQNVADQVNAIVTNPNFGGDNSASRILQERLEKLANKDSQTHSR